MLGDRPQSPSPSSNTSTFGPPTTAEHPKTIGVPDADHKIDTYRSTIGVISGAGPAGWEAWEIAASKTLSHR
jgi:hypothetical protein